MANTISTTILSTAADNDEVIPSPESNVLPKEATRDQHDVHWFFNWAEADIAPSPTYSMHEKAMLGRFSRVTTEVPPPSPRELEAAGRSSRIRRILLAMDDQRLVSVLLRWCAPPLRIPEPVRVLFGRLAGVATLTSAVEELGGIDAFVLACKRAGEKRDKDGAANFRRHAARVKLAVVREEAEALAREAFDAFATARAAYDGSVQKKALPEGRAALAEIVAQFAAQKGR